MMEQKVKAPRYKFQCQSCLIIGRELTGLTITFRGWCWKCKKPTMWKRIDK